MNLLTVPIVSGTLAGVSFTLLLLLLLKGRAKTADRVRPERPAPSGSWEDYLPTEQG